jgi:hypothetical protein
MFGNDSPPEGFDHSVESFIAENLSIFQARWIKIQSEILLKTKVEILEEILTEWYATNPPQACESWIEAELVRRAVGDFILRHHAEFLPVSPFS